VYSSSGVAAAAKKHSNGIIQIEENQLIEGVGRGEKFVSNFKIDREGKEITKCQDVEREFLSSYVVLLGEQGMRASNFDKGSTLAFHMKIILPSTSTVAAATTATFRLVPFCLHLSFALYFLVAVARRECFIARNGNGSFWRA
jgi:hypothetical protein